MLTLTLTLTTTDPGGPHPLEQAPDILEAVAESLGMTLVGLHRFSIETTARGFTAGYTIELNSGTHDPESHTVYLESNPTTRDRPGVLAFRDEQTGESVAAWLYPNDPELPALAAAVYPDAASILLDRLGLHSSSLSVTVAAYRPGKRAVVRMIAPEFTVYLKVVRPAAAGPLHARHLLWGAAGVPVPRSRGWSADGFIALESVYGVEASQVVAQLPLGPFLDELDRLTHEISLIESSDPARASLSERLPWYVQRVCSLLPAEAPRVTALGAAIERMRAAATPAEPVTVHGDLHLGQIFLDPDSLVSGFASPNRPRISGVLDIDTAGLGDPADDAAALYAHLVVSALHHDDQASPAAAESCRALAAAARSRWSRHDDTFAYRARYIAATHLLGHVLSPGAHSTQLLCAVTELVGDPSPS
ncbi:phosphotransferase family protein [Cryobacterium serini]|nr:phosphotransferase [Cryobacterium serini]